MSILIDFGPRYHNTTNPLLSLVSYDDAAVAIKYTKKCEVNDKNIYKFNLKLNPDDYILYCNVLGVKNSDIKNVSLFVGDNNKYCELKYIDNKYCFYDKECVIISEINLLSLTDLSKVFVQVELDQNSKSVIFMNKYLSSILRLQV